jgi:hypothetical protein
MVRFKIWTPDTWTRIQRFARYNSPSEGGYKITKEDIIPLVIVLLFCFCVIALAVFLGLRNWG